MKDQFQWYNKNILENIVLDFFVCFGTFEMAGKLKIASNSGISYLNVKDCKT